MLRSGDFLENLRLRETDEVQTVHLLMYHHYHYHASSPMASRKGGKSYFFGTSAQNQF